MMSMAAARFDVARFGAEVFRPSPRQADLMIVAGRALAEDGAGSPATLRSNAGAEMVISMGACATSGGVFNNYAIVQGCNQVIPVDVYVPGCPRDRSPAVFDFAIQKKIRQRKGILQARL